MKRLLLFSFISCLFATEMTTPVLPNRSSEGEPYITADFIFWRSSQEGQEYSILGSNLLGNQSVPGKIENIDYDWNPGFRVGLGWRIPHDGGDLFADYTWIQSNPKSSFSTSELLLEPYTVAAILYNVFFNALGSVQGLPIRTEGEWLFKFNTLNLGWGRNFYLSRFFSFYPKIGFKTSWIDQNFTIKYFTTQEEFDFFRSENYWAIGMRMGFENSWLFTQNWGFYSKAFASLLWSYYKVSAKDLFNDFPEPFDRTHLKLSENLHTLRPVYEVSVGLHYQTLIATKYRFLFNIGWEAQIWPSHNYYFAVATTGPHGSLVLHGLTTNFRFDF